MSGARPGRRLSAAAGVLLVLAATLDAITLSVVLTDAAAELRRIVWIDAIAVGVLVVVYAYYRIPPPLVSTVLVEALLVAALLQSRGSTRKD